MLEINKQIGIFNQLFSHVIDLSGPFCTDLALTSARPIELRNHSLEKKQTKPKLKIKKATPHATI